MSESEDKTKTAAAKPALNVTAKAFVPSAAAPTFVPKAVASAAVPATTTAPVAAVGNRAGPNNRNGGNVNNNSKYGHPQQGAPYNNNGYAAGAGGGYGGGGYYAQQQPPYGAMVAPHMQMPPLPPGATVQLIFDPYLQAQVHTVCYPNGVYLPLQQYYMQYAAMQASLLQQQQQQQQSQMQQQQSQQKSGDEPKAEGSSSDDKKDEKSVAEKEDDVDAHKAEPAVPAAAAAAAASTKSATETTKDVKVEEKGASAAATPAVAAKTTEITKPVAVAKPAAAATTAPSAAAPKAASGLAAAMSGFAALLSRKQFTKEELFALHPQNIELEDCPAELKAKYPSLSAARVHPYDRTTISVLCDKFGTLDIQPQSSGGRGGGGSNKSNNNNNNNNSNNNRGGNNNYYQNRNNNSSDSLNRHRNNNNSNDDGSEAGSPFGNRGKSSPLPKNYKSYFAPKEEDAVAVKSREGNFILNKLSVTNFEKLSNQFMELEFKSRPLMKLAVDMIVSKAQIEEHFCFMYADLCKKMVDSMTDALEETEAEEETSTTSAAAAAGADGAEKDGKLSIDAPTAGSTTSPAAPASAGGDDEDGAAGDDAALTQGAVFRQLLLNRCSEEFEFDRVKALEDIHAIPKEEIDDEARMGKEMALKKRFTGHMRFIGEIYMKDLVKPTIMNDCLNELLQSGEEEELKCLCKLLQTIGSKLEAYYTKKAKSKKNKGKGYEDIIPGHFEKIRQLSQSHESARARFMLKDLIDSRDNGWTSRLAVEKVVDLSKTRDGGGDGATPAAAAAKPVVPASVLTEETSWNEVTTTKKKKPVAAAAAPSPTPTSSAASNHKNKKNDFRANSSSGNSNHSNNSKNSNGKPVNSSSDYYNKESKSSSSSSSSSNSSGSTQKSVASAAPSSGPECVAPDKETNRKIINVFNEYYMAGIPEEPLQTIQDLIHPDFYSDIVQPVIVGSFEKKAEERDKLCVLLQYLVTQKLFTVDHVTAGVKALLEELDDFAIDFPQAAAYCSRIVAQLAVSGCVSLKSLFVDLDQDTSNFAISMRAALFVCEVAGTMRDVAGEARATEIASAEQLPAAVEQLIMGKPEEKKAEAKSLAEKYKVTSFMLV